MGRYDDRNYEIGKGKPPKRTQFQPGRSGNPKGRPKSPRRNYQAVGQDISDVLNETIEVTIEGKSKRITRYDALMRKAVNDALIGTAAHSQKAIRDFQAMGAFALDPAQIAPTAEARRKFLEGLVEANERNGDGRM